MEPITGTVAIQFNQFASYGTNRSLITLDFERRYVQWLLDRHGQNISAAAREAAMDRKHLNDLVKKHGLRRGKK